MTIANIRLFVLTALSFSTLAACTGNGTPTAADLAKLTLSVGTLTPEFSPENTLYTAAVSYSESSLQITPTIADSEAVVSVNGVDVNSGTSSGTVALNVGSNTITVVVKRDSLTKTYVIEVTRAAASTNSFLSGLALSSGTLDPSFSSGTVNYTATVPYTTTSLAMTPAASDVLSRITINGATINSGSSSGAIALNVGANVINVQVTAEDGIQVKTYTVTVTRSAASTNNNLSNLAISPGILSPTFSSGTLSYTTLVSDLAVNFTFTPTVADGTASVNYSWNSGGIVAISSGQTSSGLVLSAGANTLEVRVTSESGSTRTYTVAVTYLECPAGYYNDGTNACVPVGFGYYSPAANNNRTACANKPANAQYTSATAESANCPWSCDNGYLTTNGVSCSSYPNATVLSCNSDEVAVGLYGRSGAIIDRLGVRCAALVDGVVSSTVRDGPYYGGTGGAAFTADCPGGATALEVDGDLGNFSGQIRTGRLRYRCLDLDSLNLTPWSPSGTYWGGVTGSGAFNFQCGSGATPFGTMMNGIIVDNAGGAAYVGPLLGITCR